MKSTHLTRLITISALLLAGASRSWAGPGDIDPNFGSGGRLGQVDGTSLVLPDDRLVIGALADGGFRVARFDVNGKADPTFGDGGEALIAPPNATPALMGFDPFSAAGTPDGGLLFAGILRDAGLTRIIEAVLRLDRDGRLVTSFGGRGDGFYRLTDAPREANGWIPTTLSGIAADANGRVLLAWRSWTADGRCGEPTIVVRLTPSGVPDPAFGTNGRAEVQGVDLCGGGMFGVRNDGSIVVGARGVVIGLDATGALDGTFGVGGRVSHGLPDDWGRGFLLPDGGILLLERDSSATASNAVLTKLNRAGQLDSTFGAATGSAQLDFGAAFFGISDSRQSLHDFVLTPDAAHVYLKLAVMHPDGTTACAGGIARVSLDGTPDRSFGRQGLTCLDYGAFSFSLIASQRTGSPLLRQHGYQVGGVYRLLVDATASPGMLAIVRNGPRVDVGEADGTVSMAVIRTAGHDGAVSVGYSTGPRHLDDIDSPGHYNATPGSDFEAASGWFDWGDGDEGDREITVTILDDDADESIERFRIGISNPQGSALAPESDVYPDYLGSVDVAINDDDDAPPPSGNPTPTPTPAPAPTVGSGGGGGGSLSLATVLILCGLLLGVSASPARSAGIRTFGRRGVTQMIDGRRTRLPAHGERSQPGKPDATTWTNPFSRYVARRRGDPCGT